MTETLPETLSVEDRLQRVISYLQKTNEDADYYNARFNEIIKRLIGIHEEQLAWLQVKTAVVDESGYDLYFHHYWVNRRDYLDLLVDENYEEQKELLELYNNLKVRAVELIELKRQIEKEREFELLCEETNDQV